MHTHTYIHIHIHTYIWLGQDINHKQINPYPELAVWCPDPFLLSLSFCLTMMRVV